jgi:hypothetical protein
VSSKFVSGIYINGYNHSGNRPLFYQSLHLRQGTINIQLPQVTYEALDLPKERVQGRDQFDLDHNQDFLIRRCRLKEIEGYQVLPVDKNTGEPRGHHVLKVIEISLERDIELKLNEVLEVELEGFED